MQHACFACRKVFKKPIRVQAQATVHHPCPACAQPLTMMGTAFRAPKSADQPQWRKVEQLAGAGFLFYRNSGPRPKSLNEVSAFLQSKEGEKQGPGKLVPERLAQLTSRALRPSEARLKRSGIESKTRFEVAGRELRSSMKILVRERNEWLKGSFRSTGDGGMPVEPHVAVGRNKKIFIGLQTMLRWPT